MLPLVDLCDYGIEVELEGTVWVILMRLPGPHALAIKKNVLEPSPVHLINTANKGSILHPNSKNPPVKR